MRRDPGEPVQRAAAARVLRWTQCLLYTGGIAALAYCAWVFGDAMLFQAGERNNLERLLREGNGEVRKAARPELSLGLIGQLTIPRLELSVMVIEGTGADALRRGAGRISGTGLPGQPGNMGISAHRDTFFRPLRDIRDRDLILLTTGQGEYRYRVVSTKIVPPSEVAVLDADGGEVLTLVTCHPFFFVGPAPNRFIVRAERIGVRRGSE